MSKGRFASSGVIVGQTPRSKRDQKTDQLKGNKVTMGKNVPRQTEGAVGDITVRDVTSVGLRCYIKTNSGWYDVNSLIATFQPNWIDMGLTGSWIRYSTGTQKPQYCKDQNGFVHFRGTMKDGTNAVTAFVTLPKGFRPPNNIVTPAYYPGSLVSTGVQITNLGVCKFASVASGTSTGQIGLDGISFFAHQKVTSIGAGSTISQEHYPSGYPVL
tara:strand:+ start:568 stop:1209 length:642 start_codon:yes stop_codon:yes gene_type:complete